MQRAANVFLLAFLVEGLGDEVGLVEGGAEGGARLTRIYPKTQAEAAGLRVGDVILASIERNPLFISAVLPNQVYPPLFNRYEGGMQFGSHVDGAVRVLPNGVNGELTPYTAILCRCKWSFFTARRTAFTKA